MTAAMTTPEVSKWRASRHGFSLTYACPKSADENPIPSKIALRDFLIEKGGPADYIVASELHQNGKVHYHVSIKFVTKIETRNARYFDFMGVHPNDRGAPGKGWAAYCAKHSDYITNFYEADPFTEALSFSTVDEVADYLWKKRPRDMALHGERITANYAKRLRRAPTFEPYYGPWFMSWIDLQQYPVSMLVGESQIGKTQFAKAHFMRPYLVSSLDDLKRIPTDADGLIFDDVEWKDLKITTQIHICDIEHDRSIQECRNRPGFIPAGLPRIFCCNYGRLSVNVDDSAVRNRVKIFYYELK